MWKQEDRMGRAKAVKVEQDRQERTEAEIRRRVKIEEYQRDRVCNEKYGRGGLIQHEKEGANPGITFTSVVTRYMWIDRLGYVALCLPRLTVRSGDYITLSRPVLYQGSGNETSWCVYLCGCTRLYGCVHAYV